MATRRMTKPVSKQMTVSNNMKEDIELVSVNDIKLWEKNIKKHTDKDVVRLAKLIETYGQQTPVTVWKGDRQIRKGNGTYLAISKVLGWSSIWVKWSDFMNEAEADLYGVSDNQSSEWSEYDVDALRELFTRDDIVDFTGRNKSRLQDFSGFTGEEFDELFFEKDSDKINDENAMSTVRIECRKDEKDELISTLSQWAVESGFSDLVVH